MSELSAQAQSVIRHVMHYFEKCGDEGTVAGEAFLRALSRSVELGADTLPAMIEAICDGYVTSVKDRERV